METMNENAILLIDENRGIYIPKVFAKNYCLGKYDFYFDDMVMEDVLFLLDEKMIGTEEYWETWDELTRIPIKMRGKEPCTSIDGYWYLHEDGDLWLIPQD